MTTTSDDLLQQPLLPPTFLLYTHFFLILLCSIVSLSLSIPVLWILFNFVLSVVASLCSLRLFCPFHFFPLLVILFFVLVFSFNLFLPGLEGFYFLINLCYETYDIVFEFYELWYFLFIVLDTPVFLLYSAFFVFFCVYTHTHTYIHRNYIFIIDVMLPPWIAKPSAIFSW